MNSALPRDERATYGGSLALVAVLYGLSGALGLIYEVTFNKYLAYVFGATAYASSAVLVAFMGGLALGAHVAGRVGKHVRRPLVAYAVAELVIGMFCMLVPFAFERLGALYVSTVANHPGSMALLGVIRAGMAVVVVLVPAGGMGATLPLLARFVQGNSPAYAKRLLARFYALNTFGGAVGSLTSAYVVIPLLGLGLTMRVSATLSLMIGVIALLLGWDATFASEATAEMSTASAETELDLAVTRDAAAGRVPFRDAVLLSAGSGFMVFACEVIFVHLLALVIGTSVYAFGLMLAIFLVCLSLGTPIATRLAVRFGPAATAMSCAITGIALLSSLVLWDKLPGLFVALGAAVRSWGMRELTRAIAAAVLLGAPVIAMGTTFPLVLRAARAERVGADVGKLTVANTLGAVAGSIATSFLLLPHLGSQRSLIAIALAYLSMAALARRYALSTEVRGATRLVVVGLVLAIALPRWDLARLTSGSNIYFNEGVVPQGVVESVREDVQGGVTTVVRAPDGERTLLTNGKFEGNDGHEVLDNRGFIHLPVVFAAKRQRAMVIGLGTGTSAGTLGAYDFEHIDIVELAPAIVDAARHIFGTVNHHVLDDPRSRVLLEDGRNVLLVGHDEYDVISIEVSSIWFAGGANLYNEEFYRLAAKRLASGGVLQQWFQLHHTNRRIVATEIATLRKVFPHVLVAVSGHQGQVLASDRPFEVSRDALFDLEKVGSVRSTLENRHLVDYVKGVLMDDTGIDTFIQDTRSRYHLSARDLVSTDDNLFLEYATPRTNVPSADDIPDTLQYLQSYRTRETLPTIIQP